MSIRADVIRGHTDAVILAQLLRRDSYGYEINKNIENCSGGEFVLKEATLYTAFRRLEDSGYITSYWGDEAVGARRKYYRITEKGREAYRQARATYRSCMSTSRRRKNPKSGIFLRRLHRTRYPLRRRPTGRKSSPAGPSRLSVWVWQRRFWR